MESSYQLNFMNFVGTPFESSIVAYVYDVPDTMQDEKFYSFKTYEKKYNLKEEVYDKLYQNLNRFVHTRGQRYLEVKKRKDIVPRYNSKAFGEWYTAYKKTFGVIALSFLVIFPQILTSKDKCLKDVVTSLPTKRRKTLTDIYFFMKHVGRNQIRHEKLVA